MPDDDPEQLRRRAQSYRGMARQMNDEQAVQVLKVMARLLISQAAQMDLRRLDADSPDSSS